MLYKTWRCYCCFWDGRRATSQQMEVASRSWRRQGNRFSPGDSRAWSTGKAQITILGMFNRKTCTLKSRESAWVRLQPSSVTKYWHWTCPSSINTVKLGRKKKKTNYETTTFMHWREKNKQTGSMYLYSLRKEKVRNKSNICLGSLTGDTLPIVVQGRENSS